MNPLERRQQNITGSLRSLNISRLLWIKHTFFSQNIGKGFTTKPINQFFVSYLIPDCLSKAQYKIKAIWNLTLAQRSHALLDPQVKPVNFYRFIIVPNTQNLKPVFLRALV